ncbi:MAG: GNAT family N-acetyltransferase [Bacteroidia bacterium]|nr:GNAT family N-acetyltransferase [Bacteroidia bacterium]
MKIIDLTPEHEDLYFVCLEDWSDEIREAGDHKKNWYHRMKDSGLRVKLAVDDNGVIGGMIQYIPIEHSFAEGHDLYIVLCIWVHGYKQGRGNFKGRGMGKALLEAAETDAITAGKKGLVTWGLILPVFMRASWFKRHGYRVTDKDGIRRLLWKPFTYDARPPTWIKRKKKPLPDHGKLTITSFINGWCPAMNMVHERAIRAADLYKNEVIIEIFDTSDRKLLKDWGISDAVFINGRELRNGPPLSYKKISKKLARQVAKKGR